MFRVLTARVARGWRYLDSLDAPDITQLVETESSNTAYSAGHLLYMRGSTLMAHPFDADRRVLTGDASPVVESVQAFGGTPAGVFSASENGVLVYQPGSVISGSELRWFTRSGPTDARLGEGGFLGSVQMSRDGTRVAYNRRGSAAGATSDIWIADTASGLSNRFTPQLAIRHRTNPQERFSSLLQHVSSGEREMVSVYCN